MRRHEREIKDINETENILKSCKTCHVAMIDGNAPYVVPLSYGYELKEGILTLYFHSAPEGRKITAMKENSRVCFAITREGELIMHDNPAECSIHYASIIGNGEVIFVDDPEERCKTLSNMFARQTGTEIIFTPEQTKGVELFKIVSTDFTGKKL